jgi:2-amino-4-hydroxy-6-hydroxymethyldihydropteridine diphosphokinase
VSIFVSVGSNIAPEVNVPRAVGLLAERARVTGVSTLYWNAAEGPPGQPPFVNGVVRIESARPPRDLKFEVLRSIEAALGRRRTEDRFAPRTIDLDLILYNDEVIDAPDLVLPDPQIFVRPHLAFPLCELEPGLRLPGSILTIQEVAAGLSRRGLRPLADLTRLLKETYDGRRYPTH